MAMFDDFRGFEHLYDARVRTEDGWDFPVHRVLLALKCKYFRNILCHSATQKTDLFIPKIKGSTMKTILEYIYTGKLDFTIYNIKDILVAADLLGIEKLLNSSRYLAIAHLTTTNCIALFLEGTDNKNLGVLKASSRFIEVNFERIIRDQNSRFEDLTIDSLERVLFSDSIYVLCERVLWKAIERWINKFPEERKTHLKHLLTCIQFSDSDLEKEVLDHPLVKEDTSDIKLKEFISIQLTLPKHRVPKMFHVFTKSSISRSNFVQGVKIFLTHDENIDIWRNITTKMFCPDVVLHGSGPLIVMMETTENVIYTFDILSKTWSTLNPPNIPRWKYNVVKLGNYIYILGGFSLDEETAEIVTTAERYNFDAGRWEFAAPHSAITEGVAATVGSKIYIVGISDFYTELLSTQVYDLNTDIWLLVKAPKIYRRFFALAVYKEKLFIIGGLNNEGYLTSVEVYDAVKDTWSDFENLPFSYFLPKTVVLKDILFVYDNHSGDLYDFRCPPVLWDETCRKWQVVEASSPFCDLYIYQFCTIEDPAVIMEMRQENRDPGTIWVQSPFFIHLNS